MNAVISQIKCITATSDITILLGAHPSVKLNLMLEFISASLIAFNFRNLRQKVYINAVKKLYITRNPCFILSV